MNNIRRLVLMAFIFSLLVIILSIGEMLALQDIFKDYISKDVLSHLGISLSAELPLWTETKGEWNMVQVSRSLTGLFLILNTFTLGLCWRFLGLKKNSGIPASSTD